MGKVLLMRKKHRCLTIAGCSDWAEVFFFVEAVKNLVSMNVRLS